MPIPTISYNIRRATYSFHYSFFLNFSQFFHISGFFKLLTTPNIPWKYYRFVTVSSLSCDFFKFLTISLLHRPLSQPIPTAPAARTTTTKPRNRKLLPSSADPSSQHISSNTIILQKPSIVKYNPPHKIKSVADNSPPRLKHSIGKIFRYY